MLENVEGRDPWPGEEPARVLIDMLAGSICFDMGPEELDMATRLVERARERILDDLELAAELAGRRERGHQLL